MVFVKTCPDRRSLHRDPCLHYTSTVRGPDRFPKEMMVLRTGSETEGSERTVYEEKPLCVHRIDRYELGDIQPHEAINRRDLEAFCRSLEESGLFYKSILVDEESGTILDGTHRWAGLRELGAREVPCIGFDYLNASEIKVRTWYPVCGESYGSMRAKIREMDQELQSLEYDGVFEQTHQQPVLLGSKACVRVQSDPVEFFHQIEDLCSFSYVQNLDQVRDHVLRGGSAFLRPPLTKPQVVEIATSGESVPPKYTRHCFPYKFQHLMVPMEELIP